MTQVQGNSTKCLVFGATGFLGRHLVPHLRQQGHEVLGLGSKDCDLTDRDSLKPWTGWQPERIYHLAAWTKAGDFCLYHKGEQFLINQAINTNALWYWATHAPQARFISMGTSCAYPPFADLQEDNYLVGEPDKDLFTYAMTKRMLLCGQQALQHQFGLSWNQLIPSTLYGPKFELSDSHFIFDLIKKIHHGSQTGQPVRLWGDGYQIRELIYVQDALRLIDLAVASCENQLLNVGSGEGHTIREFAATVAQILNYDPNKILYDVNAFTGVRKKVLNTQKIHRLAPDFQFTSLLEGLSVTIADYLERTS